jgi:KipI family sensor histidine kinase inhibitor
MAEAPVPQLLWAAEDCLSLRWAPQLDCRLNAHIHRIAARVRSADLAGLRDVVPGYASLALHWDPWAVLDRRALQETLTALLADSDDAEAPDPGQTDCVEVPVCYHPALAPDLLSAAQRLQMEPATLAARHAQPCYQVALLGFAPGFPYLLGMDPALALPRHAQPRPRVAAGSVGIAGQQTGIYPGQSPGGWQIIGRTPWWLFDAHAKPPARLRPGQRLRFQSISLQQFESLAGPPT